MAFINGFVQCGFRDAPAGPNTEIPREAELDVSDVVETMEALGLLD
jgi:hypothetical protein